MKQNPNRTRRVAPPLTRFSPFAVVFVCGLEVSSVCTCQR
jgi:hypothetical protein